MSEIGSNRLPMLADEIRAAHTDVEAAALVRARRSLDAGRALIEAKSLLKHGRWLPWLKENCRGISQRTVQLYMKLAELDLEPEIIAAIGLQAAAQTEPRQYFTYPDPLTRYDEPTQRQWLLFASFVGGDWSHVEWIMRRGYGSPDEWLSDSEYRRRYSMPEPSDSFRRGWAEYQQKHATKSGEELEAMLEALVPAA